MNIKMKKILFLLLAGLLITGNAWANGIDANTSLIMHMDGLDDGTTFSDSSTSSSKGNAAVTATVTTETTGPKWGTAYADFDGSSGYLTYADHADWDITTNWTLDLQVKHTDYTGVERYVGQWEDSGNNCWRLFHIGGVGISFQIRSGAATIVNLAYASPITDSNWHHIAVCKVGNEYGLYLDGTQIKHTSDADMDTFAGSLFMGRPYDATEYFDGGIDELRIQQSNYFGAAPVAELTDTINVPTSAYSAPSVAPTGQIIWIDEIH